MATIIDAIKNIKTAPIEVTASDNILYATVEIDNSSGGILVSGTQTLYKGQGDTFFGISFTDDNHLVNMVSPGRDTVILMGLINDTPMEETIETVDTGSWKYFGWKA